MNIRSQILKILDYLFEIERIKDVQRYAEHNKVFHESVADHSYFMIVLAMKLIEEYNLNLDFKKVIKLITHHDFSEIGLAHDFDAVKTHHDKNYQKEKEIQEEKRIHELSDRHGQEILNLHNEYSEHKTKESRFVCAVDKLEATIHLINRGAGHFTDAEHVAIYPLQAVRDFPKLVPFLKDLQSHMKQEFIDNGHEWKKEYEV